MTLSIASRLAKSLNIREIQVVNTIKLLDEGATVPFIARYRKEVTDSLDDTQLRNLVEKLTYLRELDERRETILKSITEQGKLTTELEVAILAADNKTTLEDLYLPYKQKRRTKAQIAREAGLEPLALEILNNQDIAVEILAEKYGKVQFSNVGDFSDDMEVEDTNLLDFFAITSEMLIPITSAIDIIYTIYY